jgi:hypothetical protein
MHILGLASDAFPPQRFEQVICQDSQNIDGKIYRQHNKFLF